MAKQIAVVSGGLSVPSSTRLLADMLSDAVVAAVRDLGEEASIQMIELRGLAHDLTDNLLTGFARPGLQEALAVVREADALVAVTPVFSASYSGLFKTFFDVMEVGWIDEKPVLIAATAGTARHSLVLEHALRPLFAYLQANVMPLGVFAATDDFGADVYLRQRIGQAADQLARWLAGSAAASAQRRRVVDDELATPTDFETLLRKASGGLAS
ncbi:MAG: FMN reductase [Promicromonosporaceae bacterium]|nr:FMN reductase [Promicromonosporaceae bacterium]